MRVQSQFIEMFGNPVTNSKSWQTKAIMEVAPEQPSKKRMQGKVWLLNLDMIESNTGKVIEKVYETSENTLSVQPFDEGNVLFSKLRPYLNKVVVPDEYGLATTELVPLRPNQEKLHKVFLSYLLRSQQFVTFANKISGGTKMPRMPLAELRKFECILPPMSEQLKFVGITEQADKSKFDGFKSQFIEMTTRSELNKKSIGEIAEVRTGSTPSRSNPEYWNGTHYWVSAQDMGNKYIYDTLEKITDKGYATCKVVPAGSILYVCRGSIGVMSINTMDCATNQSICTATCKTGYNTEYLYYALKVAEKAIKKQGIGTSFKSLNQSAFASIEILFPAIEIQDKFATIAKQADKSKFELRKSIDAIDQVIKSLING